MSTSPRSRRWRHAPTALLAAVLLGTCGRPEPPRPSVVLITIDTLRADHLGCYGYPRDTSPAIDAFAGEALLFERASVPMSVTLPSHLSMMTSLSPLQHGVLGNHASLGEASSPAERIRTAAELLSDLGYETAAFVSSTPLKRHTGMSAGFDTYGEPGPPSRLGARTTTAALRWLSQREPGPFFLWVHYFDPHMPYTPPSPYDTMFRPDEPLRAFLEAQGETRIRPRVLWTNSLYDGEIRYVDAQVGRLLDALRERGLYDGAAVALVGDHGEGLGQHGLTGHGRTFREQLHVPLILKLPDGTGRPGERSGRLATLVDLLPTLAGALDLPFGERDRAQFAGVDLLHGRRRAGVLARRHVADAEEPTWCLTGERWKYTLRPDEDDTLYDLAADPSETRNLRAEHPDLAATMRDELVGRIRQQQGTSRAGAAAAPLPDSVIEALEELGYAR